MNTNTVIRLMSLLSIWMWIGQGQPQLTPNDFQAKITSNTVILKQPYCVFDQTCNGCEIWLVAALSSATSTFDAQFNSSAPYVLSLSPYPTAFNPSSGNFFVTKVGPLASFPCSQSSNDFYFIVGAEGKCSGINCNGLLPNGSIVSFKYLLIDVNNQTIVNASNWSPNITLLTLQNPQTINDGLSARSGAMVVITTILCVAAALLLLLFFIMLCVICCGRKEGKPISGVSQTVMNSIRIPRYDTHLKERGHPYDNPAYESEVKNYSTSDTLPKSGIQTQKL
ncbi:uroplakin-3b [Ctenopharyngodon idella]|uniref:uroplakin-3b n=1 Tax=Ctenopharyngodon idella TaxID=7959 RepID=UPI0022320791|nr:uroplakin-3b [Ctenopharyngodon idella]